MAPKPRPAIERFRGLTEYAKNGCLVWTGHIGSNGYARHWVDGKNALAHRWSYEYHVGPIAEGLQIDHLCRNRACVNPSHLEPVTPAENIRRSEANPHNAAKTHCPEGHPYSDENTYTGSGGRACFICKKANARAYYQRNRALVIERARISEQKRKKEKAA